MADYFSILNKAIDGLPENTRASRGAIYDKARIAIDRQLRAMQPAPSEDAIAIQLARLESAITQVEAAQDQEFDDTPQEGASVLSSPEVDEVSKPETSSEPEPSSMPEPEAVAVPVTAAPVEVPVPPPGFIDDVDFIDGIGAKTAEALAEEGVQGITQIAAMDDARLADLAERIGSSGLDTKQEWKGQALAMLSGELPRAKTDRERLIKMKEQLPEAAGGRLKTPEGFIDDIILIDGIGDKTREALAEEGVTTITQVAGMNAADLADLTNKIGNPGIEVKQEWKAQAIAMLSGELPRAKTDQERLKKLRESEPAPQSFEPPEGFVDDVILIDGIGEKTAAALAAVNVTGISQIAQMSDEELAELTEKIGIPGFEKTQEWKIQAIEMLNGELPRSRTDQDRLLALQSQGVGSKKIFTAPIVELAGQQEEKSEDEKPAEEPVTEVEEQVEVAKAASAFEAEPETVADPVDETGLSTEQLQEEVDADEDLTLEDIMAEMKTGDDDLEVVVPSISPESPLGQQPDLPQEIAAGSVLGKQEVEADTTAVNTDDEVVFSSSTKVPASPEMPLEPAAAPATDEPPEYVANLEEPKGLAGDAPASRQQDGSVTYSREPVAGAGIGRKLGCAALLALLGGVAYAGWMNREMIGEYSGKALIAARDLFGVSDTAETPSEPENGTSEPVAQEETPATDDTAQVEETPATEEAPQDDNTAGETTTAKDNMRLGENGESVEAGPVPETQDTVPTVEAETIQPETTEEPASDTQNAETATGEEAPQEQAPAIEEVTPQADGSQTNGDPTQSGEEAPATLVGESAFLYEEGSAGSSASRDVASVSWNLAQEAPSDGLPEEAVIKGVLEVPSRNLAMYMTIRRNSDPGLPASHIIELLFDAKPEFTGGNIDNVPRFVMKPTEEARGEGLVGVPAKIDDGFFYIALNNLPQAKETNERLLLNSSWIDIPVGYTTGRRALFTLAKGSTGEQVFRDAFADWANR